nr:MAG TPA: hypothetical protein [Caudoviricetes sp.]
MDYVGCLIVRHSYGCYLDGFYGWFKNIRP